MLPHLHLTQNLEEVTAIARRICIENRNPFIIVGGGDGTVNGVLNGLVPGAATLAVLPFGTANALTRELSIDSIEDALLKIARNRSRPASAGLIEKENIPKYFLLWAGIGFDGSVASGVRFREKKLLGKAAYVLSAVRQLISWESERMEVIADGKKYECHSLVVCNSSRYGGKFTMAPGASLFEPVFEAVCIQDTGRAGLLKAAARLLRGKGLQGTGIQVFKARELSVSGSKPVQVDGDYYCHAPMEIRIVPDFVRLIV
jgi:YegS/Rv2252/BmrU family lipid kinase